MVELLVVLAIIGILIGISIPIARMFTRNDLRDSARTIYTLLRAARVYATTYNVETAVVYSLDYPFTRDAGGAEQFSPLEDSILPDDEGPLSPLAVRAIRAASVMYKIPNAMNVFPNLPAGMLEGSDAPEYLTMMDPAQAITRRKAGVFVPTPGTGETVPLPEGYAVLLQEPMAEFVGEAGTRPGALGTTIYKADVDLPNYDPATRDFLLEYNRQMENWTQDGAAWKPSLDAIGMRPVYTYPFPMEVLPGSGGGRLQYDADLIRPRIAHVFSPDGSLKTRLADKERYRIIVAPDPETFPEERLVEVPLEGEGLVEGEIGYRPIGIIIEINRSTGSVGIGS